MNTPHAPAEGLPDQFLIAESVSVEMVADAYEKDGGIPIVVQILRDHAKNLRREAIRAINEADFVDAPDSDISLGTTPSPSEPAQGDDWPFVEEIGTNGKPTGYWLRKGSAAAARNSANPPPPAQGDVEAVMAEVESASGRACDFTWDAPVIWIETVRMILLRQLGKGGAA